MKTNIEKSGHKEQCVYICSKKDHNKKCLVIDIIGCNIYLRVATKQFLWNKMVLPKRIKEAASMQAGKECVSSHTIKYASGMQNAPSKAQN